mgnify:CR=1 FL=1
MADDSFNIGDEFAVDIETFIEGSKGVARKDQMIFIVYGAHEAGPAKVKVSRILNKIGFADYVGPADASEVDAPAHGEGQEKTEAEQKQPEETAQSEEEAPQEQEQPEGDDGSRRPNLKDGQRVEFSVSEREKGKQADDVVAADGGGAENP